MSSATTTTTTVATPPPLQPALPSAKEKKYDRQLRLWAASGQAALENAHVLLLNSGPGCAGIETLKNLILPGVGRFTIVDEAIVKEKDLGVNFFVQEESLGKSRAAETRRYLNELNPEVSSTAVQQSVSQFTQKSDWLRPYSLVLLIGPTPESQHICSHAWEHSIPLFYIHSVGFYSHFSVQLPPCFPIVDTHPDPASTQDIRLLTPWPALIDFQQRRTQHISDLDDHAHGHIPYIVILLHYLKQWKVEHEGKAPSNYGEKKQFKSLIESGTRTANPEGGEENFAEAAGAVLKSLNPSVVPSGLREVFEDAACSFENHESNFWLIAAALRQFTQIHDGQLPLPGAIPDMKAQSADYIQLQNIYKQKAREDVAEVMSFIRHHSPGSSAQVTESEVEAFCKNAAHVKLIRGSPISIPQSFDIDESKIHVEVEHKNRYRQFLQIDPDSLLPIYLAIQIHDFTTRPSPSSPTSSVSTSPSSNNLQARQTAIAEAVVHDIFNDRTPPPTRSQQASLDDTTASNPSASSLHDADPDPALQSLQTNILSHLTEIRRADGGELHNISALTGGVVAQEVIKVITKQYVPVDNVFVFDGVRSRSGVFRL